MGDARTSISLPLQAFDGALQIPEHPRCEL
jgi:hypothetical protein